MLPTGQMATSKVPFGYEFRPTDEELVENVLLSNMVPFHYPCIVRGFDQFWNKHPNEIWDMHNGSPEGKTDLYFLIERKKSSSRTIEADGSSGTWRNQGQYDVCKHNQTIGKKRRFSYKNPALPGEHLRWVMFELEDKDSVSSYVICQLHKKNESTSRKRKSQTQSEHQAQVRHSAAVQLPLPPNSQHEEDIENQGSRMVAEFFEKLEKNQNRGSTSHRQDHSLFSNDFSSPPPDDLLISLLDSHAVHPSALSVLKRKR